MKRIACICGVLALGTLLAADWPAGPANKHAYLEVVIANNTGLDVDEAGVYFGQHGCTVGIVGSGYSKGSLGWRQPVTTNAIIRWRDTHSVKKEETECVSNLKQIYVGFQMYPPDNSGRCPAGFLWQERVWTSADFIGGKDGRDTNAPPARVRPLFLTWAQARYFGAQQTWALSLPTRGAF